MLTAFLTFLFILLYKSMEVTADLKSNASNFAALSQSRNTHFDRGNNTGDSWFDNLSSTLQAVLQQF
ncbi:hypothetical protein DdX_18193 [Ditylenchus destructor]|uniref:Uncharacterized protein n=1 Tax=Ditylenchus destructor TaxID=166010 RepID=A0AAD4MQI8_9BILA|nr:hypothetical protein DdX_18193 [Ditylenchus destructor]